MIGGEQSQVELVRLAQFVLDNVKRAVNEHLELVLF